MLETGKCRKEKKEGAKKDFEPATRWPLPLPQSLLPSESPLQVWPHAHTWSSTCTCHRNTSHILSTGTDKPLLPPPSMYDHYRDHHHHQKTSQITPQLHVFFSPWEKNRFINKDRQILGFSRSKENPKKKEFQKFKTGDKIPKQPPPRHPIPHKTPQIHKPWNKKRQNRERERSHTKTKPRRIPKGKVPLEMKTAFIIK